MGCVGVGLGAVPCVGDELFTSCFFAIFSILVSKSSFSATAVAAVAFSYWSFKESSTCESDVLPELADLVLLPLVFGSMEPRLINLVLEQTHLSLPHLPHKHLLRGIPPMHTNALKAASSNIALYHTAITTAKFKNFYLQANPYINIATISSDLRPRNPRCGHDLTNIHAFDLRFEVSDDLCVFTV